MSATMMSANTLSATNSRAAMDSVNAVLNFETVDFAPLDLDALETDAEYLAMNPAERVAYRTELVAWRQRLALQQSLHQAQGLRREPVDLERLVFCIFGIAISVLVMTCLVLRTVA